jgi:predicted nuclease of predicted toxin-antitoxin system
MKILIDMNLSPAWAALLREAGHEAVHWADVGKADASDKTICDHARTHGQVLFTHDLDFGAVLAATRAAGPSVVQVRTRDVDPVSLGPTLLAVFSKCQSFLQQGALVSLDESRHRVRVLPIRT